MLIFSDFLGRGFLPVSQKTPIRTMDEIIENNSDNIPYEEIGACSYGITRITCFITTTAMTAMKNARKIDDE